MLWKGELNIFSFGVEQQPLTQSLFVSIFSRMNNFENELFQTVDAILHLLGHQPKVTRESVAVKQEKTTKPKGARLIKNASELDRILQNMS